MAVHQGGRGPGHVSRKTVIGVFEPGETPGGAVAPVLTRTSVAGTNPMSWSSDYTDLIIDTDYICCRWRVDGGAWTNETNVLFDSAFFMDYGVDAATYPWPLFAAATFNGGEVIDVQEGILRAPDATVWSTSLTDTMAVTVNTGVWIAEGDSLTSSATSYAEQYAAANLALTFTNIATGGQSLSHMVADLAATQAYDAEFASICAGANDECTYASLRDDWITPVRAGGAKVIVCSALPQDTGVNPAHDATYVSTFNAAAIAGFGTEFDGYVDWSKSPISVWSATNYSDYVHLNSTGQTNSLPNFAGEMNRLRGISNTPVILMLTDKSGQTASTVITSDPCWLNGLGYGETVAISVTGGEYRIDGGAWTSSAGTAGNCKVELRGTSSGTPSGTVDVVFTAGGVSDTFTITTAAAATGVKWNSAAKSSYITLSNSDYTATAPVNQGGVVNVIGDTGKTTGKWYFEVHVVMGTAFHTAGVGLANSLPADFTFPGSASATAITYHSNSLVYRNSGNDGGANQLDYESPTGTYVIGVAFDADNDKVWFAQNGTFAGNPAAGTGGHSPTGITTYYPLFMGQDPAETGTIKSLTADMTYSPPSGFTALGGS